MVAHTCPGCSVTSCDEWYTLTPISLTCRITLHFEAVNNAMYVWLNGQLLGYSQDSCLPAEFDVTDIVGTGQNILTVQVRITITGMSYPGCHGSAKSVNALIFDMVHLDSASCLGMQVMRFSDGSYLEDMDHWWLSGIYR